MHRKIKSFFLQSLRVWRVLKRPTKQEFLTISKVSAIGMLALGLIGFLISIIMGFFI